MYFHIHLQPYFHFMSTFLLEFTRILCTYLSRKDKSWLKIWNYLEMAESWNGRIWQHTQLMSKTVMNHLFPGLSKHKSVTGSSTATCGKRQHLWRAVQDYCGHIVKSPLGIKTCGVTSYPRLLWTSSKVSPWNTFRDYNCSGQYKGNLYCLARGLDFLAMR
jgi:hypothetical protein